jgi:hypothetical protein
MIVQRLVNRRSLATDQDPQPSDFKANGGFGVDPQRRIVSPQRIRVKADRAISRPAEL